MMTLYKNRVYKSDQTFTGTAGANLQTSLSNVADELDSTDSRLRRSWFAPSVVCARGNVGNNGLSANDGAGGNAISATGRML